MRTLPAGPQPRWRSFAQNPVSCQADFLHRPLSGRFGFPLPEAAPFKDGRPGFFFAVSRGSGYEIQTPRLVNGIGSSLVGTKKERAAWNDTPFQTRGAPEKACREGREPGTFLERGSSFFRRAACFRVKTYVARQRQTGRGKRVWPEIFPWRAWNKTASAGKSSNNQVISIE